MVSPASSQTVIAMTGGNIYEVFTWLAVTHLSFSTHTNINKHKKRQAPAQSASSPSKFVAFPNITEALPYFQASSWVVQKRSIF
jgi:hypothetical protein